MSFHVSFSKKEFIMLYCHLFADRETGRRPSQHRDRFSTYDQTAGQV